jgi:hypothetical protein
VTWEAPNAHYRWFGVPFTVGEGVTWSIESRDGGARSLSAHVWATFPPGMRGRIVEWAFTRLGGIEKDREHTRTELRYLKKAIEARVTAHGFDNPAERVMGRLRQATGTAHGFFMDPSQRAPNVGAVNHRMEQMRNTA